MKKGEYINAVESISLTDKQLATLKQKLANRKQNYKIKQKRPLRVACALLLAVILVTGAILIPLVAQHKSEPAITDNISTGNMGSESETESSDDNNSEPAEPIIKNVPDWYEPGELTVGTIKSNRMGYLSATADNALGGLVAPVNESNLKEVIQSDEIILPTGMEFQGSAINDYLKVTVSSGEHAGCGDIYYNIKNGDIVCFSHLFKKAMTAAGLHYDVFSFCKCNSDMTKAIFDTQIYGNSIEFVLLDIENNTIREIPTPGGCVMSILVTPDYKYGYYSGPNYEVFGDDVFQIDLTTFETKCISKINGISYIANMGGWLNISSNGDLIYFNVLNEDGDHGTGSDARFFIYSAEKQTAIITMGEIIKFFDNGRIVVVDTADGIKLIDTYTGENIEDIGRMQPYDKYVAEAKYTSSVYGGTYTVLVRSYLDPTKESIIIERGVSYYLIKEDYVYTYKKDTDYIRIFSLKSFESFTITVNESFINAINNVAQGYQADCYFTINSDLTRIILFYHISKVQEISFEQTVLHVICESFPEANCIEDMYDLIYNYSSYKIGSCYGGYVDGATDARSCVMYKGDGFNCLVVYNEGGFTLAMVEDYRDNTFTLYRIGFNAFYMSSDLYLNGLFDIVSYDELKPNYTKYRRELSPSSSSQKTLEIFNFLSVEEAFIDFAEFYKGDTLDYDKIFEYIYSPENVLKHYHIGYVTDVKKQSNVGYDILNINLFEELIHIAYNQDLKTYSTSQKVKLFNDSGSMIHDYADFRIVCNSHSDKRSSSYPFCYYFAVGTSSEGKKYINHSGRYAYIDDETYDRLCQICKTLWSNYTSIYGVADW